MNDTKEAILLTALHLFSQSGYEAVSVRDISGALNISPGALYKHYHSKQAIFQSILVRMEENDRMHALKFGLPADEYSVSPASYDNISLQSIAAFAEAQFRYWTEDDFASSFRRMLTIEQYREPELRALYDGYLSTGPLSYTADLFRSMHDCDPSALALEFYSPLYMLISCCDSAQDKAQPLAAARAHIADFISKYKSKLRRYTMHYPKSEKYSSHEFMSKIMGPNPLKLLEELMQESRIPADSIVMDLGSGQGLTSMFLSKEYGFTVYAADLWSDPDENRKYFDELGLSRLQIIPVKADATDLPFDDNFFDAVVSTDSYNYFGRDPEYLDRCLMRVVKPGGYVYIAIPGMHNDCHDDLPPELLLSWTPEQLDYMHDVNYWRSMVSQCQGANVLSVCEMESNDEVWADWLMQENEYAVGDRKSMNAGGGKYLNFIKIVLQKNSVR